MVRTATGKLGRSAERRALRYLRRHGLRPVARNFRTRGGEIDLIMLDGSCLTFVEVRFRSQSSLADAALTVDARKQQKLIRAASRFLASHDMYRSHVCRFDVLGMDGDDRGQTRIVWIRDAFRPGM